MVTLINTSGTVQEFPTPQAGYINEDALRKVREACILLKLRDPGVGPGTGQPSAS